MIALLAAPAHAEGPLEAEPSIEAELAIRTGVQIGRLTRTDAYAVLEASAAATPQIEWRLFRLRAPLEIAHHQAIGASLSELAGRGGLELRVSLGPELRAYAEGGVEGQWRPDWPDQYQPVEDGFAPTDRYSSWTRGGGGRLELVPIERQHVELRYRYELTDYADDPGFDPIDEPTHLVPSDHEEHELELGWHHRGDDFALGGDLEAVQRHYFLARARDAGTGLTHAGSGGPPPNPLQNEWEIEPSVDVEFELLDDRLEIEVSYGHEIAIDTFQGYESYQGPHPEVRIEWHATDTVQLEADFDFKYRMYGSGSYAEGPGHPALEEGERRYDLRFTPGLALEWRFAEGWAFTAELEYTMRRTNFPDYAPGVFPASRQYAIQWDYDDFRAVAGVELALEAGPESEE
jgi:hypothetical protein